jgi:hypothetical protein
MFLVPQLRPSLTFEVGELGSRLSCDNRNAILDRR